MFVEKLSCPVRHYAWGERATADRSPYISALLGAEAGDLPWAELWIGAHPSGSAVVKSTGEPLAKLIQEQPMWMLGLAPQENSPQPALPFLLKVLCCSEPLSIQSHPDKATAAKLHAILPKEFPDANHKPEVLLALNDFRMMAGFRPSKEIVTDLDASPALRPWRKALSEEPTLEELTRFVLEADAPLLQNMANQYCQEEHTGIQAELFHILQVNSCFGIAAVQNHANFVGIIPQPTYGIAAAFHIFNRRDEIYNTQETDNRAQFHGHQIHLAKGGCRISHHKIKF